jgi:hypothetical protein
VLIEVDQVSRPQRCNVIDLNQEGVHELCSSDADGWWTAPDADGVSFSIPICTRHLFAELKAQQAQRERAG